MVQQSMANLFANKQQLTIDQVITVARHELVKFDIKKSVFYKLIEKMNIQ
jgi:hypothetical protein